MKAAVEHVEQEYAFSQRRAFNLLTVAVSSVRNQAQRPLSSLNYLTPAEIAGQASYGKDLGCAHFKTVNGDSNFPTAMRAQS